MNRFAGFVVLCVFGAVSLHATLLTSPLAGGTTTTFPDDVSSLCYSGPTSGPYPVAGFQVSASGGSACYPYSDSFGLQVNGTWDNGLIGDGSGGTTLTVDLGGLYSWVGGFVDYEIKFEGNPPDALPPVMAAIAADGVTVLESYDLSVFAPILTPGGYNEGAFRGIDYGSAEIRYLEFGGSHTLMHSITLGGSNVAEPATILLAGSALAAFGLGLLRRRRG